MLVSPKKSLVKSFRTWSSLVTKFNQRNLTTFGPYGLACSILKIINTPKNRKRLQTFHLRHANSVPKFTEKLSPVKKYQSDESQTHGNKHTTCIDNSIESNTNDLESTFREKSSYCICINDPDRWSDGGSMVECESCKQWYRCILKKKFKDRFFNNKAVSFICGLKGCNFREGFFMVKVQSFPQLIKLK